MTAVAALPYLDLASREYFRRLNIMQKRAVAFLMVLFNGGYKAEFRRKLGEAFLFGGFGEAVVHIGPFVIFALGGMEEVLRCIADAVKLLEPHFRVLFFIVGGFLEERRNLLIALFFCDR